MQRNDRGYCRFDLRYSQPMIELSVLVQFEGCCRTRSNSFWEKHYSLAVVTWAMKVSVALMPVIFTSIVT